MQLSDLRVTAGLLGQRPAGEGVVTEAPPSTGGPAPSQVLPASVQACPACPWRLANQGRATSGGWYTRRNLDRLWAGLRRGARMSCHPTDPRMAELAADGYPGFRAAPDGTSTRECAGALVVVQREFLLLQHSYAADLRRYLAARPRGLTRRGVVALLERALLGGTVLDTVQMRALELTDPDIGHPALTWSGPPAATTSSDRSTR